MGWTPLLTAALIFGVAQTGGNAQRPASQVASKAATWLLAFENKSTNELVMDKRFPAFLRRHVTTKPTKYWGDGKPTIPAKDAIDFLHGPPDDVRVAEKRYLTASACVPHDCMDRGLLWVDTTTGATVFAASVYLSPVPMVNNRAHLWLFTNTALTSSTLPPTLLAAVAQWSGETNGDNSHTAITEVTVVQPDSTQIKLTPADVHAWTSTRSAGK